MAHPISSSNDASYKEVVHSIKSIISTTDCGKVVVYDPVSINVPDGSDDHLIVHHNKKMILSCDLVVAFVNTPSFGVGMEIMFAMANNIPVYSFRDNGFKNAWTEMHCTKMFHHSVDLAIGIVEFFSKKPRGVFGDNQ